MRHGTWLVLALLMLPGGCAREAAGSGGLRAVADTVDGVPRLTYPAEGGLPLDLTVDTLERVGDVLGDDDAYQFDRVRTAGLAGDAQGNVYLLDGASRRVLSYDADGRHRGTWGRAGEGPGELRSPFALALGAGDTIWVLDPMAGRITGYPQPEGDPRVVTLMDLGGFPNNGFAVSGDGFLLQTTAPIRVSGKGGGSFTTAAPGRRSGPPPPPSEKPGASGEKGEDAGAPKIPIFRVTGDGMPADTLWQAPQPPMNVVEVGGGSGAGRTMLALAMPPQFQPTLRWAAFSDGGIAVADSDDYRINLVDASGHRRMVIRRDLPPWPVGDAEKEYAREKVRKSRLEIGGAGVDMGPIIEKQLASMTFAATVPRITKLRVDTQDRLWVGVATDRPEETGRVDLYDREGRFVGSLVGLDVPDAFFADGRAASVVKDPDTDVQQIAVLKLTGH